MRTVRVPQECLGIFSVVSSPIVQEPRRLLNDGGADGGWACRTPPSIRAERKSMVIGSPSPFFAMTSGKKSTRATFPEGGKVCVVLIAYEFFADLIAKHNDGRRCAVCRSPTWSANRTVVCRLSSLSLPGMGGTRHDTD